MLFAALATVALPLVAALTRLTHDNFSEILKLAPNSTELMPRRIHVILAYGFVKEGIIDNS